MSSAPSAELLPPNPCLLAILLLVKINSEPQIVFHYPPRPGQDNSHFRRYLAQQKKDDLGSSSSDDESTSSHEEQSQINVKTSSLKTGDNTPELDVEEAGSASPKKGDVLKSQYKKAKWNDIFGLRSYSLARLLCPDVSAHKRKFELTIDDKAFIGWPVFASDGEHWRRKKRNKPSKLPKDKTETGDEATPQNDQFLGDGYLTARFAQDASESSGQDAQKEDKQDVLEKESVTTRKERNVKTKPEYSPKKTEPDAEKKDKLNMFHLVFVMSPPPHEYQRRVMDMYDNVITKFSKALRWEQIRSNYLMKELHAISQHTYEKRPKDENRSLAILYHQFLSQSSLAKAISKVFNNISSSRIAHVTLTPKLTFSLQIPAPTSITSLPGPLSPQSPGLWLTTATSLPVDSEVHVSSSQLASHFTILLLSDISSILSDIQDTASPLTGPLTHFLHVSKPTKSFLKISQSCGIPLQDIQLMAYHLIYWRRARAIPPLHHRDTYITSPNADMGKLASASSKFAKHFSALPSLPKLLSMLSLPRPFSTLIPSKDYKESYLDILAWLLRDGWVTQLRTFAWIRVPAHIRAATEDRERPERSLDSSVELPPKEETGTAADLRRNLAVPGPSSPASSVTSSHTTVPFRPSRTTLSESHSPSVITHPRRVSNLESKQLSSISKYVLNRQGAEIQAAWDKCVKYFDGAHAIETIAVQEDWKRKRVADLVASWEAEELLLISRH
ncbi:MAG: hypothetical protein Q9214_003807, partial [Letrouitia sp. 1 TL-2023]